MLGEQARRRPGAPAYTFIDYDVDAAGFSQTLTWSEVNERVQVIANELASCGSPGDRVAILAPQGLEYIVGLLGVMEAGFIVGRIKDLLIVDGRNHYPDDIEATIQEITGGRAAAVSVPDDGGERLVAIVELTKRGSSDEEVLSRLDGIKREVTSSISASYGLRVADLVLVSPGSLPITTSGKVRRSACAERYRQDEFTRLETA
jgi:long chain fatty acid CoA FadD26